MIHAAGNSSKDIDKNDNFPNRKMEDGKPEPNNWLEIGASSWKDSDTFIGSFSNYGKKSVDFFSPGVDVYSTTPGNEYDTFSGTSMAAPATAGIAALVMSYYPEFSAAEVKQILKASARKFDGLKFKKPGSEEKVALDELSITGGLVNAYEALKMAEKMKKNKVKE